MKEHSLSAILNHFCVYMHYIFDIRWEFCFVVFFGQGLSPPPPDGYIRYVLVDFGENKSVVSGFIYPFLWCGKSGVNAGFLSKQLGGWREICVHLRGHDSPPPLAASDGCGHVTAGNAVLSSVRRHPSPKLPCAVATANHRAYSGPFITTTTANTTATTTASHFLLFFLKNNHAKRDKSTTTIEFRCHTL